MALVMPLSARDSRTKPTNPLLTRDDVGRAKPSCYDLPADGFAFGRPGNHDAEGAREVSMRWENHTPSAGPKRDHLCFPVFNKKALSAGIANARDLKAYKQTSDLQVLESTKPELAASAPAPAVPTPRAVVPSPRAASARGVKKDLLPSDVVPEFTYGRRVRPSTPIQSVLSGRYAEAGEKELAEHYAQLRKAQEASQGQVRKIQLTAATRGHAAGAKKVLSEVSAKTTPRGAPSGSKEPFKMNRFARVGSKIGTSKSRQMMAAGIVVDPALEDDTKTTDVEPTPTETQAYMEMQA